MKRADKATYLLVETLRFYADPKNWDDGCIFDYTGGEPALKDGGDRARAALKELGYGNS